MRARILAIAAIGLALALVAAPAAAQHCWPASISLLVRDPHGGVFDPERLDSLDFSPKPGEESRFAVHPERIEAGDASVVQGPTPVLTWSAQGRCRVDMREVVLREGAAVMRLWMDFHIDTLRRPGASRYLLETPPLATGTWRLDVCALPPGRPGGRAVIPAQWVRVSASGDSATPQEPQRCVTSARPLD